MLRLLSSTLALATLIVSAPSAAHAQASVELADPVEPGAADIEDERASRRADAVLVARMEELLVQRARGESVSGWIGGLTTIGLGAVLVGSAIWLSIDESGFGTPNLGAILGLAVAPLSIASGIYSLLGIRTHGDRLTRWRAAMEGELSDVELGRFEGELRAEANSARLGRWASFALGVGVLVGGVTTMVLGGALDGFDDEFRAIVVGGGGGITLLGAILTGTSFLESSVEQMWNQYRGGDATPSADIDIRPMVGPGGVGLVGTF